MSGSIGIPAPFYTFDGDPTNAPVTVINPPQGAFVFDVNGTEGTMYRKLSQAGDNSLYAEYRLNSGRSLIIEATEDNQVIQAASNDMIGLKVARPNFTVLMPPNPAIGDSVEIYDMLGTFSANHVFVDSPIINTDNGPLEMDINFCDVVLIWLDLPVGWQVIRRA